LLNFLIFALTQETSQHAAKQKRARMSRLIHILIKEGSSLAELAFHQFGQGFKRFFLLLACSG